MKFVNVFGFNVFSDHLNQIELKKERKILNTISPNSYGISTKDPLFRDALKKTDYLVLDGVYFALASMLLKGTNIQKNQGPAVFYHFMDRINRTGGKIFFLGSTDKVLEKIKIRSKTEYPNIIIETLSPPFKPVLDESDNQVIIKKINQFEPDVVFVGMTCPKQEKWAYQNKGKINMSLICSIGAVFDWYAGNEKNISPIWWTLRLAWLKRTIDRPEILKRYPNIGIFFWHLFLALIGFKKYKNGSF